MSVTVGLSIQREANEPAPPSYAVMSVAGLIGPFEKAAATSTEAFAARFPLDTCVRFQSTDATARMIDPDGDMGRAIGLINAQLGRTQTGAQIIVVRTAEGDDDDATIAGIVGNAAARSGIHAFKRGGPDVGAYPRLIHIPGGWASRTQVGVTGYVVTAAGAGYDTVPTASLPVGAGAGTGFAATVTLTAGAVTGLTITDPGEGFMPGTYPLTLTGGTPETPAVVTVTVARMANPIVAALPAVLNAFLGIAYIQAPGISEQGDLDFRELHASERIGIVTPGVLVTNTAGDVVATDQAAIQIGLHIRRDFQADGRPFNPILNQPVTGIVAPTRAIEFSWLDDSVEAQQLLARQIGPLVRGEAGDDFAAAEGGFVSFAFETIGSEPIWSQMHKVRGRDFIELTVIRTFRSYFGRFRLTRQTIETIVDTVEDVLRIAEARGEILGYACRFDPNLNNPSDLRTGHIFIEAKFEEAPVFRKATLLSRPYVQAIDDLIAALSGQAGVLVEG
ncbi:hypothetical protein ABB55_14115 [Prosthecomicrobium hirschii]|uniref:Phage tail protein n=1 Tax=Prosthecodimorpha hirschii TaxID=665126 RepID=A0A0P6WF34_9HYPH|nr:hypothetical protein [Prosthecomicrobium hirschii]KPL53208.1 hypothetical protein ABB55_14115 [Prosthecomicrobium hirschii]